MHAHCTLPYTLCMLFTNPYILRYLNRGDDASCTYGATGAGPRLVAEGSWAVGGAVAVHQVARQMRASTNLNFSDFFLTGFGARSPILGLQREVQRSAARRLCALAGFHYFVAPTIRWKPPVGFIFVGCHQGWNAL